MIGKIISHYKILEKLGEGGMGVVYKAEDTSLDRLVALKFLPSQAHACEAEKARFLREAKAASAVNHANVCTIYDIQEDDGQLFIVMEYVEGRTLKKEIQGGPLLLSKATDLAIQIADGLQEAHNKGIIHRDIKSENIMVNARNQSKIMDFGLAKIKGSVKLTQTTSMVGTLAYMAPEQIRGATIDARSDIFSFGVVLYEMLTGRLPFHSENEAAAIYSIMNEEPIPIQNHLPESSSELQHILDRALEKDPEDRYQSVHDMLIDLRRLNKVTGKDSHKNAIPTSTRYLGAAASILSKFRASRTAVIFAFIIVVAVIGLWTLLNKSEPLLNPNMKLRLIQIPFKNMWYGSISADGNWITFPAQDENGKWDVYLMNASTGEPHRITYDSCNLIFSSYISPDGSFVLYSRLPSMTSRQLVRISSLGGSPKIIYEHPNLLSGGWIGDGSRIWISLDIKLTKSGLSSLELWSCDADGSDLKFVMSDTVVTITRLFYAYYFSPDQKYIAWTKNFPEGYSEIMIRDLSDGTDRQLTHDKKFADDPLWSPQGLIIYSSNRGGNANLWMIRAEGGDPIQITRGTGPDRILGLTKDGSKLLYSEHQLVGQVKLCNLIDGSLRQITVEDYIRNRPAISPDGEYIAVPTQVSSYESRARTIILMNRNGGDARKLTDDKTTASYLSWSPDGKWLSYRSRKANEPEDSNKVYIQNIDQPGQPICRGKGLVEHWVNATDFIIFRSLKSFRGSVSHERLMPFSQDSMYALPVVDEKYVAVYSLRKRTEGWYLVPGSEYDSTTGIAGARHFIQGAFSHQFTQGNRYMYYVESGTNNLFRVSLPYGTPKLIRKIPGLVNSFSIRNDGSEIVFTEFERRARYVVLENVFK